MLTYGTEFIIWLSNAFPLFNLNLSMTMIAHITPKYSFRHTLEDRITSLNVRRELGVELLFLRVES